MACSDDEVMYSLLGFTGCTDLIERPTGPFSAVTFVVLITRIVDGIMKPKCDFSLTRVKRYIEYIREMSDALFEMLQGMIAAIGSLYAVIS